MKQRSGTQHNKYFKSKRSLQRANFQIKYQDDFNCDNSKVCGIINLGNNCYLNSGLQILASCEELVYLLKKYENGTNEDNIVSYLKEALNTLLSSSRIYDPSNFINCFCSNNNDFIKGSQCCSQNFIRTLIRNINDFLILKDSENISKNNEYHPKNYKEKKEFDKFLKSNKIYPESQVLNIFSGITKSHSFGKCPKCGTTIDNYSFSYFIDQNIYLDEFESNQEFNFKEVLKANIGNLNTLTMDCENCNEEIDIKEETKIIKLPDILIFTLERYQGPTNNVKIIPDGILNMKDYIDNSLDIKNTEYELFAINIRFGRSANYGHEICQVKRNGKWYEINDRYGEIIKYISRFDSSYGLFYRKKTNKYQKDFNKKNDETNNQINNQINNQMNNQRNNQMNNQRNNQINNQINNQMNNQRNKNEMKKSIYNKNNDIPNNIKRYSNIDNNIDYDGEETENENENSSNKTKNYGLTYLYSALQIISSFDELISYLNTNIRSFNSTSITYKTNSIIKNILNNKDIDLNEFHKSFSKKDTDFLIGSKCNSQHSIRSIINLINNEDKNRNSINSKNSINKITYYKDQSKEYKNFIKQILPQSRPHSIFSIWIKHKSQGKCKYCHRNQEKSSFEDIIDFDIDISINSKKEPICFSELLKNQLESSDDLRTECNYCKKEISLKEQKTIINLPEILIFTLKRFDLNNNSINKIKIIPDNEIKMGNYLDENYKENKTRYKLFAVNIRKGEDINLGYQICIVKRDKEWYKIDESNKEPINSISYNDYSDGLFYRRC